MDIMPKQTWLGQILKIFLVFCYTQLHIYGSFLCYMTSTNSLSCVSMDGTQASLNWVLRLCFLRQSACRWGCSHQGWACTSVPGWVCCWYPFPWLWDFWKAPTVVLAFQCLAFRLRSGHLMKPSLPGISPIHQLKSHPGVLTSICRGPLWGLLPCSQDLSWL